MDEHEIETGLNRQAEAVDAQIEAIRQRQHAPTEAQLVIDGEVCCLDCEEPVPGARLAAMPGAVRCAECQADRETGVG